MISSNFSRTLTLLRKEKGVSQRSVAKDLGISQALLSHYENGIREPGLTFVVKACDYYGVSADFLLGRTLSRDGTTIVDAESLYDYSAEKDNILRGSVMATLSKKLLVNSVSILFDLLGKVGSKEAIKACSDYLSSAVYQMFRHLYRADGANNEDFFAVPARHFSTGITRADMTCAEVDYVEALAGRVKEAGSLPPHQSRRPYPVLPRGLPVPAPGHPQHRGAAQPPDGGLPRRGEIEPPSPGRSPLQKGPLSPCTSKRPGPAACRIRSFAVWGRKSAATGPQQGPPPGGRWGRRSSRRYGRRAGWRRSRGIPPGGG